jgi:hypothetical protein
MNWLQQRLDDKAYLYFDNFNSNPTYNTDGIVNCLLQPGQLRNQLFKSMLVTSIHLFNFLHRD